VERVPAGTDPDDVVLTPGEGDLLIMGGACQREWLHGVPRAATDRPRISLTWRWTSRRGRPDTNPRITTVATSATPIVSPARVAARL
jgi:hypothetical protein